ncbi:hypothetical protein Drose_23150 [Dactylosporangium roseum]|uniref:Uncharacterized protein n=1 Tax=Dactylosporangium roseum TaxID=47989 RepID=A0ABY5YWM2_9ACTN|nr:hypothetical protein [Dactylosporangium roseum]UWZ34145.1 hypothetical protein Drose_23150 [Dactylosporangium roseum]
MSSLLYSAERMTIRDEQLLDWSVRELDGDLRLTGLCPACRHESATTVPLSVVAYESHVRPRSRTATVGCRCRQAHEGRPGDTPDAGCGRTWAVRAVLGADGYTLTTADDVDLVEAADALRLATGDELATLRGGAEKWIAGITAVYGIFGITGAVVGRDALTALPGWGRVLVGVAVLAALGAAGFAVIRAYRVAYGWPVAQPVGDDVELRNWYARRRREPAAAATALRWAVHAAIGSLGALAVALGLLWFLPVREPASAPVQVTRTDGARLCGTLLVAKGPDGIRLRRAGDGEVAVVPLVQIASLSAVAKC